MAKKVAVNSSFGCEARETKMRRNLGVLMRKGLLVGNRYLPCFPFLHHHHHRKLLSNSFKSLTLTSIPGTIPSSSPHTFSPSTPKLPFSSYYSLHSLNLNFNPIPPPFTFTLTRPCSSESDSEPESPLNLVVLESLDKYYDALKYVEDRSILAVFFYTTPRCCLSTMWTTQDFEELCSRFQHLRIFIVYVQQPHSDLNLDEVKPCISELKRPLYRGTFKGMKADWFACLDNKFLSRVDPRNNFDLSVSRMYSTFLPNNVLDYVPGSKHYTDGYRLVGDGLAADQFSGKYKYECNGVICEKPAIYFLISDDDAKYWLSLSKSPSLSKHLLSIYHMESHPRGVLVVCEYFDFTFGVLLKSQAIFTLTQLVLIPS